MFICLIVILSVWSYKETSASKAVVLVSNKELFTTKGYPLDTFNEIGHYYYMDKEAIRVTCKAKHRYKDCLTQIAHLNSREEHIRSNKDNECRAVTMQLRLEPYNDGHIILCLANGYQTAIFLHLKKTRHPVIYDIPTPASTTAVQTTTKQFPTRTTQVPTRTTQVPTRTTQVPITTTQSYNTTSAPAAAIASEGNPNKEDGLNIPWVIVAASGGAISVFVLAGCCVTQYILRRIKVKSRNAETNYENFSSADSALPHPKQSNEPIYSETAYQQPETSGPNYQNNLDILYSKPVPKKYRQKKNNVANNKNAVKTPGFNEDISNNYAEIDHGNARTLRIEARRGDEATYSEVTQWKDPTIDRKYDNVFENGRYVNAHDRTEYVEPAYCGVKIHK